MAPKHWATIFSSEFGYIFHLPYLLDLSNSKNHKPNEWFRLAVFILRNILNMLTFSFLVYKVDTLNLNVALSQISDSEYKLYALAFTIISAILYVISYIYVSFHGDNIPLNEAIYFIQHVSIINFLFGLTANGIPTIRILSWIMFLFNIIAVVVLAYYFMIKVPINDRFPYISNDIETYNLGMRPMDGDDTLFCSLPEIDCDRSKTLNEEDFLEIVKIVAPLLCGSIVIHFLFIPNELEYYNILLYKSK